MKRLVQRLSGAVPAGLLRTVPVRRLVMDLELRVNREVLKHAVMRRITCPHSGVVLDIRKAVYFNVTTAENVCGSDVVDGPVWDRIAETVRDTCAAKGMTLEVIDGRVINTRKR